SGFRPLPRGRKPRRQRPIERQVIERLEWKNLFSSGILAMEMRYGVRAGKPSCIVAFLMNSFLLCHSAIAHRAASVLYYQMVMTLLRRGNSRTKYRRQTNAGAFNIDWLIIRTMK